MEIQEYERMFRLENYYWWFQGRKSIVINLVRKFLPKNVNPNILDAGCGTGMIFSHLESYGTVVGIDLSKEALKFCHERRLRPLIHGNLTKLPFKNESFDLIVALDILEHIEKHENAASEFYRCLKKDGVIIFTVPAHPFIWSEHDIALHHFRRYTMCNFKDLLKTQNWKTLKISYAISFTFPAVVLYRVFSKIFKKEKQAPKTDLIILPKFFNSILTNLIRIEAFLIKYIKLPFGISIVAALKK